MGNFLVFWDFWAAGALRGGLFPAGALRCPAGLGFSAKFWVISEKSMAGICGRVPRFFRILGLRADLFTSGSLWGSDFRRNFWREFVGVSRIL